MVTIKIVGFCLKICMYCKHSDFGINSCCCSAENVYFTDHSSFGRKIVFITLLVPSSEEINGTHSAFASLKCGAIFFQCNSYQKVLFVYGHENWLNWSRLWPTNFCMVLFTSGRLLPIGNELHERANFGRIKVTWKPINTKWEITYHVWNQWYEVSII